METYKIVRRYFEHENKTIKTGLTLEEAQEHCKDPETSSSTCKEHDNVLHCREMGAWFDSYIEE